MEPDQPSPIVNPVSTTGTPSPVSSSSDSKPNLKVILLVVIGLVLAVGAGAYFLMPKTAPVVQQPAAQIPQQPIVAPLTLTVDSPQNDTLLSDQTVMVSGTTSPNATVTIYTVSDENTVTADSNGNYQGTISLDKGINVLTVTALDENDQEKSLNVNVAYDNGSV